LTGSSDLDVHAVVSGSRCKDYGFEKAFGDQLAKEPLPYA
jgi:hypothetical protein